MMEMTTHLMGVINASFHALQNVKICTFGKCQMCNSGYYYFNIRYSHNYDNLLTQQFFQIEQNQQPNYFVEIDVLVCGIGKIQQAEECNNGNNFPKDGCYIVIYNPFQLYRNASLILACNVVQNMNQQTLVITQYKNQVITQYKNQFNLQVLTLLIFNVIIFVILRGQESNIIINYLNLGVQKMYFFLKMQFIQAKPKSIAINVKIVLRFNIFNVWSPIACFLLMVGHLPIVYTQGQLNSFCFQNNAIKIQIIVWIVILSVQKIVNCYKNPQECLVCTLHYIMINYECQLHQGCKKCSNSIFYDIITVQMEK
ncbi:unnamed protein product [Paramecium octaurelia]|uniref:Transmembrane protein n=1 Tax=Paramecium octaurelia TaxID=43137 RepID=A0A8S1YS05_PAROT|nr:unnamed protein product [Paramecium octaurelia]